MISRGTHFGIALFSAAAVVLVALVAMDRTSPGPLTSVHGRESELSGGRNCSECHGGWFSSMTSACLECHEAIETQIAQSDGLHGVLGKSKADQCQLCHSEHHGPTFAMVNRQSFAQAGVPSAEDFDHRLIGFEMNGAHLETLCAECHVHANDAVLARGDFRFLGLDQDCASCHEDPHDGRMVVACAGCHGQQEWDELHSIGHERFLPLIGSHADVGCQDCHAEGDRHSLEFLGARKRRPVPRECTACHDSPHDGGFVAAVAGTIAATEGASCVECHEAEHESFRDVRLVLASELHAASGFALDAPHDTACCLDCHGPAEADFAARYPGRAAGECSRCHEDPHGGQFAEGPFAGQDCVACHDWHQFEPHAFTTERHALAALELSGRHLEIDCEECHNVPAADRPRIFRGTPSDCEGCHADVHLGFFDAFTASLPALQHGDCARCHGTATFSPVAGGPFDHAGWTGFPVVGAHEQSNCEACHPLAEHSDENGRTFGRVAEHFGPFEGCATCHEDPHEGQFDSAALPREIEGREGCVRCHVESSFRALPHGFDHGLWTDFALAGAHKKAACTACHARRRQPDAVGRTWEPALGPGCADCHTDPHAGQFREGGRTDCARCHTSALRSFLSFDHDRDSRFSLGPAHEPLECSACHFPVIQGGVEVIRYRPIGAECVDCHGVHEEVLLRRKPTRT